MEELMKYRWDNRYLHWGVTAFLVIAASMLFYYGIFHMKTLIVGIKSFFGIMAPIIYGVVLAYVLNPLVKFFERKVIYRILEKREVKLHKSGVRAVRWFCVLFSMLLFGISIYALIMMILPQLIKSIMNIIYSFPYYVQVVEKWLNSFIEHGGELNKETLDMLTRYSNQAQNYLTTNILPQMQSMLRNISAGVFDVLIFLKNFLIGAIVSLYVLADKEQFVAKSKMVVYAALPAKAANTLIHAMRFTHKTFGGFFNGKLLDSLIIGILCYIGVTLLDMPYTILVSVIVGVTNIIPFFGPYIGAVPCTLLILLVDPIKGLYFAIFILVLQQFDGNILGPKILGESTGLSSFMVIVAILVGGGLFGIPGMIVGVPVCAVLYATLWNLIGHSLKDKKVPDNMENYINIDCIDEATGQVIPMDMGIQIQAEEDEPGKDSLFMKIWTKAQELLILLWKYIQKYFAKFKDFSKEQYKKLKDKAKEYKNKNNEGK